jgi:hypothetical protein
LLWLLAALLGGTLLLLVALMQPESRPDVRSLLGVDPDYFEPVRASSVSYSKIASQLLIRAGGGQVEASGEHPVLIKISLPGIAPVHGRLPGRGMLHWEALLGLLAKALETRGDLRRFYLVSDPKARGRIAVVLAGVKEADSLKREGFLGGELEVPSEEVKGMPLAMGTMARLYPDKKVASGIFAGSVEWDGVHWQGSFRLDRAGRLLEGTLAERHCFGGLEFPEASKMVFFPGSTKVLEVRAGGEVVSGHQHFPAGTEFGFNEDGSPLYAELPDGRALKWES